MRRFRIALLLTALLTSAPAYATQVSASASFFSWEWQYSVKYWKIRWTIRAEEIDISSHTHTKVGVQGSLLSKSNNECNDSGWNQLQTLQTPAWNESTVIEVTSTFYQGPSGTNYRVSADPRHDPYPTSGVTLGGVAHSNCEFKRKDDDEDGYYDDDEAGSERDCGNPVDDDPDVNPGAQEVCGNGIDDNCKDGIDEQWCEPEGEPAPGCDCIWSPIILKLAPGLIRLTNAANGVWFDLNRDAVIDRVAWTERGDETDAFLALDHNANGIVDDGSELFGNGSICGRRSSFKNGFEVLRYLDTPGMGGNFDGAIDSRDAIFQQLLLWVDRNHNGFSEPEELQKFSDRFRAIGWFYEESRRRDRYGNLFRWRGYSYSVEGQLRLAWDVMLRHQ